MASGLALLFDEMMNPYVSRYLVASDAVTATIRTAHDFASEEKALLEKLRMEFGASKAYYVSSMDRKWSQANFERAKKLPDVKFYFEEGKAPESWRSPNDLGACFYLKIHLKETDQQLQLYSPEVGSDDFEKVKASVEAFRARASAFLKTDYELGDVGGKASGYYGWERSMWHHLYGFDASEQFKGLKCHVLKNAPTIYNVGDAGHLLSLTSRASQKMEKPASLADCREISERDFKSITNREVTNPEGRLEKAKAGRSPRTLWERATLKYTL